jgi:hypothetical protein
MVQKDITARTSEAQKSLTKVRQKDGSLPGQETKLAEGGGPHLKTI